MKKMIFYILLIIGCSAAAQQPLIHSHNDYAQNEPFVNAWRNKVFSMEADVYAGDSLFVAHDRHEIDSNKTLLAMYLQPIIDLFAIHQGRISDDTGYAPVLMIDIKENSELVIPELVKLLAPYRKVFDRSLNSYAVQVVLSGDRGPIAQWNHWPAYILFDGRPYENYDSTTVKRIAFVSDSYLNYVQSKDRTENGLRQLSAKVHRQGKLLRLWAIPDNETSWGNLRQLGVDIINTDKVAACRNFFSATHTDQ